jgi:hypothetical protein
MEVRKHWIVFFGQALSLFVGSVFPFAIFVAVKMFVPKVYLTYFSYISLSGNTYALLLFFYILWLLFLWISFFVEWTKYYLDVWYVTEKRIIDIQQKRIFDREITNLRFDKIQDVTVDVHGFIPTVLNFGNIKVQTASEDNIDFFMNTVRKPDEVRRVIFSQHNEIGDAPIRYAKKEVDVEMGENSK